MSDIELKILNEKIGKEIPLPTYATDGSAGLDLRACIDDVITIPAGDVELIPTGIAIHIADPGFAGIIIPRSGLGHREGIILGNSVGLIDSDYQGELFVSCWNRNRYRAVHISPAQRIAQMVVIPVAIAEFTVVEDFSVGSGRGGRGFGSTGNS